MSLFGALVLFSVIFVFGQSAPPRASEDNPPPRSDSQEQPEVAPQPGQPADASVPSGPNDSSSRTTIIDLSPPAGDAQEHPDSEIPQGSVAEDVQELHPWNPHRADKDVEIGDYYFKDGNLRAAESRYREALYYYSNDAVANFRLAQVLEKKGELTEAAQYYEKYLKILPHGTYAESSHKALERLNSKTKAAK